MIWGEALAVVYAPSSRFVEKRQAFEALRTLAVRSFLEGMLFHRKGRPDTNSLTRLLVFLSKKLSYSGERRSGAG